MTLDSNIIIIKLPRFSYSTKLPKVAKKEGLKLTYVLRLDKELVLIQINCLMLSIHSKIARLDYKIISVLSSNLQHC